MTFFVKWVCICNIRSTAPFYCNFISRGHVPNQWFFIVQWSLLLLFDLLSFVWNVSSYFRIIVAGKTLSSHPKVSRERRKLIADDDVWNDQFDIYMNLAEKSLKCQKSSANTSTRIVLQNLEQISYALKISNWKFYSSCNYAVKIGWSG